MTVPWQASKNEENMKKKTVIPILLILLLSCSNMHKSIESRHISDTIYVSYYPYTFTSNISNPCSTMAEESDKKESDSIIYITQENFDRIKHLFNKNKSTTTKNGCDSRILVKYGNDVICMGTDSCLCAINDTNIGIDLDVMYMIKWKSGYYNYFDRTELIYDDAIEKYGFPDDYNYNRPDKDDTNQIKKFTLRKIAFLPLSDQ